jgi:hypothetical protein
VDFNCYGFGSPREVCRAIAAATIPFDQLIEEGTWCHLSFDPRMRRQILTKREGGGYELGLTRTERTIHDVHRRQEDLPPGRRLPALRGRGYYNPRAVGGRRPAGGPGRRHGRFHPSWGEDGA